MRVTMEPNDDDVLRDQVSRFARERVEPIAGELDLYDREIPPSLITEMASLGYFGICLSEDYGGLGLPLRSLCIVTEELAKVSLSVASVIHRNAACGHILQKFGTVVQKDKWLRGLATGELMSSSAGTEPQAGSDAGNIQTRAILDSERNEYVLRGTKQFITFANRAHLLFVYVRTDSSTKHGGISLIVVEKEPGPDFVPPQLTGSKIPVAGYRGMGTYTLHFDDLRVPAANLIGERPGFGFKQLMGAYEVARIGFAFRCTGLALGAAAEAISYSKDRVQFGQAISNFQAVRFRIADMTTEIEAARQLGFYAADLFDRNMKADVAAGMAKLFASEVAHRACWNALYIHGGLGYASESKVNRFWRDSALLPIGEGTSDVQREVIARSIVGRQI